MSVTLLCFLLFLLKCYIFEMENYAHCICTALNDPGVKNLFSFFNCILYQILSEMRLSIKTIFQKNVMKTLKKLYKKLKF